MKNKGTSTRLNLMTCSLLCSLCHNPTDPNQPWYGHHMVIHNCETMTPSTTRRQSMTTIHHESNEEFPMRREELTRGPPQGSAMFAEPPFQSYPQPAMRNQSGTYGLRIPTLPTIYPRAKKGHGLIASSCPVVVPMPEPSPFPSS